MIKVCNHCKDSKSLDNFGKNKRFSDGLHVTCKECTKKQSAKTRNKLKVFIEEKECNNCKTTKCINDFTKNPSAKDGFNSKCKSCRKLVDKTYRDKIKEKVKINNKTYRLNNLEKFKNYLNLYKKKRKLEDPIFKLSNNISSLIRESFKNRSMKKTSKSFEILGLSYEEFYTYLNNNEFGFKCLETK